MSAKMKAATTRQGQQQRQLRREKNNDTDNIKGKDAMVPDKTPYNIRSCENPNFVL